MTVRYARGLGVLFLILGTVLVGLQLVLLRYRAASFVALVPAVLNLVLGVAYMVRPFFALEPNAVVLRALLGPLRKTYPFERLDEVRIRDGAVWVGERKIGARRWLSHKGDWAALEARLAAGGS